MVKTSGSHPSTSPLDLRDLAGLAWRQRWLILVILALCAAIAVLACLGLPKTYRSTALVLFDPAAAGAAPGATTAATPASVDAEVEAIGSDAVLRPVAMALLAEGLGDELASPWAVLRDLVVHVPAALFHSLDETPADADRELRVAIARLSHRLTVSRRGLSSVIAIEARAGQPDLAAHLADRVAAAYLAQGFARKTRLAGIARDGTVTRRDAAERRWLADGAAASRHGRQGGQGAADMAAFLAREAQLQDRARTSQALFQLAASQMDALDQQVAVLQPDARLLAAPTPADEPASPPRPLLAAGVMMLGLCAAFGVGHLADRRRPAGEEEVEATLGHPVLAALPRLAGAATDRQGLAAAVEPNGLLGEALARLRFGIDRLQEERRGVGGAGSDQAGGKANGKADGFVVLVTATTRGEGKTLMAAALARSLALAGRRTMLLDCDLARAGLSALMGADPDIGLGDHLAGVPGGLSAFARRDEASGADMLLGVADPDAPADRLLSGAAFAALLAHARSLYEVVILDAGSVATGVEPLVLARLADAILYVIDANGPDRERIERSLSLVARTRPLPIGLVLNRMPAPHGRPRRRA